MSDKKSGLRVSFSLGQFVCGVHGPKLRSFDFLNACVAVSVGFAACVCLGEGICGVFWQRFYCARVVRECCIAGTCAHALFCLAIPSLHHISFCFGCAHCRVNGSRTRLAVTRCPWIFQGRFERSGGFFRVALSWLLVRTSALRVLRGMPFVAYAYVAWMPRVLDFQDLWRTHLFSISKQY